MSIKDVELFLLDMDGTIYLDDTVIDGAPQAVRYLRSKGKRVCFLTNNSSKSRSVYFDKLTRLGFMPRLDEIYTSGLAAIEYLKHSRAGDSVYLLGTQALREEFCGAGISLTDERPDTVVVGYDTSLTYDRLAKACIYIREGAHYVATHPDLNCPAKGGYLPDTGSFIELIKASTDRLPDVVCGKPHSLMAQCIAAHYHAPANKIAMIGDRLTTDIRFGNNNGFLSVLVLSGETTPELLAQSPDKPSMVLASIKDLVE